MKRFSAFALFLILATTSIASAQNAFITRGTFDFGGSADALASGDLDGDGDIDLIVGNRGQINTVWRNRGDGRLDEIAQPAFPTDSETMAIDLADFDGDGDLDAFVGNAYANGDDCNGDACGRNELWLNDGTGVFSLYWSDNVNGGTWGMDVVDLDANGKLDVIAANAGSGTTSSVIYENGLSWSVGSGTTGSFTVHVLDDSGGSLLPSGTGLTGIFSREVASGRINDDTRPDLVFINGTYQNASLILLNTSTPGNLSFNWRTYGPTPWNATSLVVNDFTGDGFDDIAAGGSDSFADNGFEARVAIFENGAGNTMLAPSYVSSNRYVVFDMTSGDFDNDGELDIVISGYEWSGTFYSGLKGDGSGGFTQVLLPKADRSALVTDMVDNGVPDLVLGQSIGTLNSVEEAQQTPAGQYLVYSTADSGTGSLRSAVADANAIANGAGPDEILFDIPGAGPHTISLDSELAITQPLIINGISQTDATCGTAPGNRDLRIALTTQGAALGTSIMRLALAATGSTVRGLAFGASTGFGLIVDGANDNTIACNFIGTNAAGTGMAEINDVALQVSAATGNTIGGGSAADGNVITGAVDGALVISGGSGNAVRNNIIGLNKSASAALPPNNGGDAGIHVVQSPNTVIQNNQMGGFADVAMQVDNSSGPDISFNYVGTNANRAGTFPNGTGIRLANNTDDGKLLLNYVTGSTGNAIEIIDGPDGSSIGNNIINNRLYLNGGLGIDLGADGVTTNDVGDVDSGPNDLFNYPVNVVAQLNTDNILVLAWETSAPVSGNYVAEFYSLDTNGEGAADRVFAATQSDLSRVLTTFGSYGLVPGDELVVSHSEFPSGNTSEFSPAFAVIGPYTVNNTNDSGPGSLRQAILNANVNADVNTITFAIPGAGPHVIQPLSDFPQITQTVTIDGFTQPGSSPNTLDFNNGTDAVHMIEIDGRDVIANGFDVRGTGSTIRGLSITGFLTRAINLAGSGGHRVIGNSMITDPSSADTWAIWISSSNNTVGTSDVADRNVVGGWGGSAVTIQGASPSANVIEYNYFGVTADGTTSIAPFPSSPGNNSTAAISMDATSNANIFRNNLASGFLGGSAVNVGGFDNEVRDNLIGTNAAGNAVIPNANGIQLSKNGAAASTGTIVEANIVVGSLQQGIRSTDGASDGARIADNFVGLFLSGLPAPNAGNGIDLNNSINSTVIGNNVSFNGGNGIAVYGTSALGNAIVRNWTNENGGIGIDLGNDGATANDVGDVDSGPNNLINAPVITNAEILLDGRLSLTLDMDIAGSTPFEMDIFEADADGTEGGRYVAGAGFPSLQATETVAIPGSAAASGIEDGDVVLVTIRDADGNSSELSNSFAVTTVVANPLVVTNTDDSGLGSLRAAIEAANTTPGVDTITFDLTGGNVYTIAPLSGFPVLTESVIIDGLSQTDATCGTTDFTDRALKIVLDGSNMPYDDVTYQNPLGLDIAEGTNNVTIQGLVIHSFPGGGIRIGMDNTGNVIRCNYIGTDETGLIARGNYGSGVQIDGYYSVSTGNTIGGPNANDGNLISANMGDEVHFEPGADGNSVRNNLIGTDATGAAKLPAPAGYFGSADPSNLANNVGFGSNQGGGNTIRDNVVGGFNVGIGLGSVNDGTRDWGGSNLVYGNHIGTDRSGTVDLGNFSGVDLNGNGPGSEVIGGSGAGDGNVIRYNYFGVRMGYAQNSIIQYNDISLNTTGALFELAGLFATVEHNFIHDNSAYGVRVSNADSGVIRYNTISGNGIDGISLINVAQFLTISDNIIGLAEDGETPMGNVGNGISLNNSGQNDVYRNVIAANGDTGIDIRNNANRNVLWGNTIGLTQSGALVAGDSNLNGVIVASSQETQIGVAGNDPNIISGNREAGLIIEEPGATLNTVSGNLIGVDINGSAVRPNGTDGIRIWFGAHDNTIGGSVAARNVISGNGHHGISIADANLDTPTLVNEAIVISHNHIGVSFDGSSAIGNGWAGIYAGYSSKDLVISNNVTSGNGGSGIALDNGISGSTISANISGLNALGNAPLPNGDDGIAVTNGSFNNQVSGNTTSGNLKSGINFFNVGPGNVAISNIVGTDASGTGQFGNDWHGFQIGGGGTIQVGGAGVGNTIAFNTDAGVIVYAPDGWDVSNAFISENIMYGNGGLGIDLKLDSGTDGSLGTLNQQGGRNGNDPADTDDGPNGLINAPVFNWATRQASNVEMEVFFDGPLPVTIEVFEADADNDDGRTLLGTSVVSTKRTFLSFPSGSVAAGDYLVATATGTEGTSEFALAFEVALGEDATLVRDQVLTDTEVMTFKLASDLNAIPGMSAAMQAAIESWKSVSTSDVAARIAYGGVTTTTAPVLTDYENVITKSSALVPLSSNTLAVASKLLLAPATPGEEATILSADIVFNADLIGQATGIGTDLVKGIWDAQAVATHEFGHTLGMRHSGVSTATMFFSIPSGTSYRSLEADDKAWISQRYPSGTAASTFGSISGSVTDGESGLSNPLSGALVVARHTTSGARVHAYADMDGTYLIPGLLPGTYEVSIQPLDGLVDNVPGMRPGTVSPYLRAITQNATFSEEFWSGSAESDIETEDLPEPVVVQAGATTAAVDFISNDDNTAPVVNGATPKGTRVPVRPEIAVTFSEPVTTANIVFQLWNVTTGLQVPGTGQVPGGASVVATFDIAPGTNLVYENVYEIRVQNATDKKGNVNGDLFTAQFTVRPADIVPPTVTSVTPGDNAVDVNSGTDIVITFSEPMDQVAIAGGITVACTTAPLNASCPTSVPGTLTFPTSSVIEGLPGWVAVFKPESRLVEGATYSVSLAASLTDVSGNALGVVPPSTFTTQANVEPVIADFAPADGSTGLSIRTSVFADFNEPVVLVPGNVIMESGTTSVPGVAELLNDGKRIVFRPMQPLNYATAYTVTFSGAIQDASDPPMPLGTSLTIGFTTASAPVAIQLTSVSPPVAIPGAVVTFGGSGFSPNAQQNVIAFPAIGGGTVPAVAESSTLNSLTVVVPDGVQSGPVTVSYGGSTDAINLELYDVLPQLDPAVKRYTAESAPRDVEITPDGGTAYVTNTGAGTVSVLDVATGELVVPNGIQVGDQPLKVVLSPDGSRIYVSNFGSHTVSVIDTATLTVTETIDVGLNPFGLAISPDGKRLYVAEYTSRKISIIDVDGDSGTENRAIARISVESNERDGAVEPDGGVRLGADSNPRDVELSPDGGTLFFSTQELGLRYLVLDANGSANEDAATVRITKESGTRDVEVSPDGGVVWVTTLTGALEGYRIPDDLLLDGSFQAVARLGKESNSREVEVSPDGGLLYVTSFDLGLVQIYAISSQIIPSTNSATGTVFALTLEPIKTIIVGDQPEAVVFSPAAQVAIVTNSGSDDVTVLRFTDEPPVVSNPDTDGDGLLDVDEVLLGTDPTLADTDGDGLSDGDEVNTIGTNPLSDDTDGDTLLDGDEFNGGVTSPLLADTDDDGLHDDVEVAAGSLTLANNPDTDGDGKLDGVDADADGSGAPDVRQRMLADFDAFVAGLSNGNAGGNGGGLGKGNEPVVIAAAKTVDDYLSKGGGKSGKSSKSDKSDKSSKSDKSEKDGPSAEDIIDDIREKLEDNLNSKLWEESMRPDEKRGESMFNNDKNVLKKLDDLNALLEDSDEDIRDLATSILRTDLDIVTHLLADLDATSCASDKKCRKELEKAEESFADALDELEIESASDEDLALRSRKDEDKAIDDLRKAWQSAVKALGKAGASYGKGIDEALLAEVPVEFDLSQNYPNPFNPTTTINFALKEAVEVRLDVFDLLGRHIQTLVQQPLDAGNHQIQFDASRLASGMYLYRIQAGDFVQVKQMTLMK